MTTSPAYGFDEDPATRRLLRSRPPREALAWAAAATGGQVLSARPLRGGLSSAVHELTIRGGVAAPVRRVVLRRSVRPELSAEGPGLVTREARALQFVSRLGIPAPELLAVDPTGAEAGVPALLMTRLPGRVEWSPADVERWLQRLAAVLAPIHRAALPPPGVIGRYTPYRQRSYLPPAWARWPAVWERAVRIFHGPTPDGPVVFLHRDFHPGNVLWQRGRVTGVVDWQSAAVGPPSVDVGHCRGNLLRYGADVADRFTAIWERGSGQRYHPWADVVTIIGFLDGLRDEPPSDARVVEDALARAVAELG